MKVYTEVRLGSSRDWEIWIGSFLGALLAAPVIYFVTVLILSLG
jgi:hypothetical protein